MAEVTRENPNAFKTLADALGAMDGVTGKVGWFAGAAYPDGTPVAYVASIQEFGVPSQNIPSRSFMRSTALEKDGEWREIANTLSARVLAGKMTPAQAMEILTLQAEGDIAAKIASIQAPPLSPITLGARKYRSQGKKVTGATIGEIARKLKEGKLDVSGVSTKPLVDTAVLVNTISHVVADGA